MGTDSFEKFPKRKPGSKTLDEVELEKIHDNALELMEDEKYDEAYDEFDRIVGFETNPTDYGVFTEWWMDALYHQFDILSELGKNDKALEMIDGLLMINPNDVDYLLGKGYVLDETEQYEKSLKCYKKILEIESDDIDALVNMSSSLIGLKKFRDATDYADKAIKIDSKSDDAWFNKGEALLNLGEDKNALKCFENVMNIDRTDSDTWYMKARCLSNLSKNKDEILDALLVACSLEPENKDDAKKEENFQALQDNDRFKKIVK